CHAGAPTLASRTRTDLPDGLIFRNRVKSFSEKYFALSECRITGMVAAVPHPHEGRFAIVTDVGRGMRWPHGVARICAAGTLRHIPSAVMPRACGASSIPEAFRLNSL